MEYEVTRVDVEERRLAAVRAVVPRGELSLQIRERLGEVWQFLRANGITATRHNVILYDGRSTETGFLDCTFGVEVAQSFHPIEPVVEASTPAGPVVTTTHWGSYDGLGGANQAVRVWCTERGLKLSGLSWEVYGDWTEDLAQLRTDVCYQLATPDR